MRAAGYEPEVRPSRAVEWPYRGGDPALHAEALARAKAGGADGEVVIGADTIVVVDGQVLGKPAGAAHAAAMLRRLSGRTHEVVTAVAVRSGCGIQSAHARARVTFRVLGEAEILEYAAGAEPLDKAGGYAYQGRAGGFVTRLEGEADTVIGLPIALLDRLLPPDLRRGRSPP